MVIEPRVIAVNYVCYIDNNMLFSCWK